MRTTNGNIQFRQIKKLTVKPEKKLKNKKNFFDKILSKNIKIKNELKLKEFIKIVSQILNYLQILESKNPILFKKFFNEFKKILKNHSSFKNFLQIKDIEDHYKLIRLLKIIKQTVNNTRIKDIEHTEVTNKKKNKKEITLFTRKPLFKKEIEFKNTEKKIQRFYNKENEQFERMIKEFKNFIKEKKLVIENNKLEEIFVKVEENIKPDNSIKPEIKHVEVKYKPSIIDHTKFETFLNKTIRQAQFKLVSQNYSEALFSLKPDKLGRMLLKLSVDNGIVNAKIVVENHNTESLFNKNLTLLKQAFQELGYNVGNFEVSVGNFDNFEFNKPEEYFYKINKKSLKGGISGIGEYELTIPEIYQEFNEINYII